MGAGTGRLLRLAAVLLLVVSLAPGYYHYVHFANRQGPFQPIYEKFDLSALANRTVYFYVSEQGPAQLAPGDSFAAVVSQLRAAARAWNSVETSELRVAFGGLTSIGAPQGTPGIDVVFDEVPPGILAMGVPTVKGEVAAGSSGLFVPIVRAVVTFPRDMSSRPSYTDSFFLTAVHELGHTLGLQHTLTSCVMSTEVTRATTRAKPLGADDVAGLSVLYPAAEFRSATAAISGRVTMGTEGVSLASVVAISPNGPAVSALTNPDGTYKIEGLQPGLSYLIYAHPLPPPLPSETTPANIILPLDLERRSFAVGAFFDTMFFPGVKTASQAFPLSVPAGTTLENVNFSVQRRTSLPLYAVQTYSFPGQIAVKPAVVNRYGTRPYLVAAGTGLVSGGAPVSGLGVSFIGGAASVPQGGVRSYPSSSSYVQVDVEFGLAAAEGPYHMVFQAGGDVYVLPAGLLAVTKPPPALVTLSPAVDSTGARVAAVTGLNLFPDTRFLFDGQQALKVVEEGGRWLLTPPPASPGHRAAVVAVNSDGQSTLFWQSPGYYSYEGSELPAVTVTPNTLPAGSEAVLEITGTGVAFADGQLGLGFGSSDIAVRRLWVTGPGRVLASVSVAPGALAGPASLTVANGLQLFRQALAITVQPANPRQLTLNPQLINMATGQTSVQPGNTALLLVANLTPALAAGSLTLTFNGERVPILTASAGQITFQVPPSAKAGVAVLALQAGTETSLPVAVTIDNPPATVLAAFAGGALVDASRPARAAELIELWVANLADSGAAVSAGRLKVIVGGVEHAALQVAPSATQAGVHLVQFYLNPALPAGQLPLIVTLDGRLSQAATIFVRGS